MHMVFFKLYVTAAIVQVPVTAITEVGGGGWRNERAPRRMTLVKRTVSRIADPDRR